MNFAIIGASGNVGRKTIEILEKSKIKLDNLFLVASSKSAGKKIKFRNKEIEIEVLENYDFSRAQITFFAAGSNIAKEWAPKASKKTIIIDNSSYFRMQKNVPLVVSEVNPEALDKHNNIISNPNCSTMQMVLVLKPLHDEYKIKRVVVSTYQAVSGAGKASMDELLDQSKKSRPNILFIPTASAEPPEYIDNFYKVFEKLNCVPRHLSLFKRTPDLDKLFNQQDIFYVGGGNTKSMLAVWKEWNIDKFLKREYKKEKVMSGVSAGAICWFNKGVTDSWEKNLRLLNCLNFINDACCPHYDEEP